MQSQDGPVQAVEGLCSDTATHHHSACGSDKFKC